MGSSNSIFRWLPLLAILLATALSAGEQITLAFPASHNVVTLFVPDRPAAMQMDILHLKIEKAELSADGMARRTLASAGDWVMSSYISPAQRKLDARGLRDFSWSGLRTGPYTPVQVRTYEVGQVAVLEYMIDSFQGRNLHQKNVFAYMVSGDQWLDVHISKVLYDSNDEKFLNSMLHSIRVIDQYQPDARTEYGTGSMFYLKEDWVRATQHYEKALAAERNNRKRSLSPTEWRGLIDNLGMAYGMSRHWEKAKATFQFGITQDPGYPMFHYNLACAYAELDDPESALADLKFAFVYRGNEIAGKGMPDPARDNSFKSLLTDTRFVDLVRQVCPRSRQTATGYVCQ